MEDSTGDIAQKIIDTKNFTNTSEFYHFFAKTIRNKVPKPRETIDRKGLFQKREKSELYDSMGVITNEEVEDSPVEENYIHRLSSPNLNTFGEKKEKEKNEEKNEEIDWKSKYEKLQGKYNLLEEQNESLTQICKDLSETRSQLEEKLSVLKKVNPNSSPKITIERIPITCYSISEFKGNPEERHLSMKKGDEILIYDRHKSGWWYGYSVNNKEFGFLPYTFLDISKK
eukprot:TRINITY_DN11769_c0_g1_i1.p1 TRINITY_DN11769_c0_g1~~TRINITY_DN11769_c0_g1_i1.p1  ORF type:complete len:228 (+),score=59.38 TRINITY_DN11769_c0_g1_i1:16-699(+)